MISNYLSTADCLICIPKFDEEPRLPAFAPKPKVKVQFDNGEEKTLFEFFPDEISFSEKEFIGLTEEAAHRLRFDKDKMYLQS